MFRIINTDSMQLSAESVIEFIMKSSAQLARYRT